MKFGISLVSTVKDWTVIRLLYDVDGDRNESWPPRDFTYEEVYGLSTGSAAGGS
ncbi:hypothetical protein ALC53_01945 [Atta colombica]|uniref:Uncharacterized protein n=1 Tax=Atta colombica TaxID=520822 RepID=A0A195BSJ3_9HYME|nr:hypothetical protein ALC53_01945 [Atta colombica]